MVTGAVVEVNVHWLLLTDLERWEAVEMLEEYIAAARPGSLRSRVAADLMLQLTLPPERIQFAPLDAE